MLQRHKKVRCVGCSTPPPPHTHITTHGGGGGGYPQKTSQKTPRGLKSGVAAALHCSHAISRWTVPFQQSSSSSSTCHVVRPKRTLCMATQKQHPPAAPVLVAAEFFHSFPIRL
jgi:hypothetical protein